MWKYLACRRASLYSSSALSFPFDSLCLELSDLGTKHDWLTLLMEYWVYFLLRGLEKTQDVLSVGLQRRTFEEWMLLPSICCLNVHFQFFLWPVPCYMIGMRCWLAQITFLLSSSLPFSVLKMLVKQLIASATTRLSGRRKKKGKGKWKELRRLGDKVWPCRDSENGIISLKYTVLSRSPNLPQIQIGLLFANFKKNRHTDICFYVQTYQYWTFLEVELGQKACKFKIMIGISKLPSRNFVPNYIYIINVWERHFSQILTKFLFISIFIDEK